jgi:hypothetical protein
MDCAFDRFVFNLLSNLRNLRCYMDYGDLSWLWVKKTPDRYSLELFKYIFAQWRATSKSGVDSTLWCSHILGIIWLWPISVPMCLCLCCYETNQIGKLGSIPNFCADCFCCLCNAFFNCGNWKAIGDRIPKHVI